MHDAREKGFLRREGKTYEVQGRDIINFGFNVETLMRYQLTGRFISVSRFFLSDNLRAALCYARPHDSKRRGFPSWSRQEDY